jgi:hypothetical protein
MTKMQQAIEASQQYAPYNGLPEFWQGYREYLRGERTDLENVPAQAYDRGAEMAMKLERGA